MTDYTPAGQEMANRLFVEQGRRKDLGIERLCNELGELRARVEALEAAQQQPEPIDEEENDRRFRACLDLIDNATPEQIRAAAGLPEPSSLVERVSKAIDGRINPDQWLHREAARAAIREVAAWMRERGGWNQATAAHVLEQEAE